MTELSVLSVGGYLACTDLKRQSSQAYSEESTRFHKFLGLSLDQADIFVISEAFTLTDTSQPWQQTKHECKTKSKVPVYVRCTARQKRITSTRGRRGRRLSQNHRLQSARETRLVVTHNINPNISSNPTVHRLIQGSTHH